MNAPVVDIAPPRFAPPRPTRRSCEVARYFGLVFDESAPRPDSVRLALPPRTVACITGPSGAGKSTLLHRADRRLRDLNWRIIEPAKLRLRDVPAVNLLGDSTEEAMRLLSSAGLAESQCFVRRHSELSDGQRFRLRLALAFDSARRTRPADRPVALVIDEFAATLDRPTARTVARLLSRFVRRTPGADRLRALVATPHDDLIDALAPDALVRIDLAGRIDVAQSEAANVRARSAGEGSDERARAGLSSSRSGQHSGQPGSLKKSSTPSSRDFEISPGDYNDYQRLAPWHYLAGPPATCVKVLTVRATQGSGEPVAALVVSMPTLNGAWRDLAWPGRYTTGDKRRDARRLNDELRCISRVVVDPRYRGLGLARRLVRAYLDRPLTPMTEAVAAMGRFCRFFQNAGMTAYALPPPARRIRLLDALAHAGVEPWRLATPDAAFDRAVRTAGRDFLERELRRWARCSRADSAPENEPIDRLFRRACRRLGGPVMAFAATYPTPNVESTQ